MSEAFYVRAKRVLSVGIEATIDRAEQAAGTSLLREAIREVDRTIDQVRREQDAAADRKVRAESQKKAADKQASEWEAKARFTLEKGRTDLAEAAIGRQLDLEKQSKKFADVIEQAREEIDKLAETLIGLDARKAQMVVDLHEFEKAVRDAELGGSDKASFERSIDRKIERAQQNFDRVMGIVAERKAAGVDSDFAKNSAEIDKLQRSDDISERLAALQAQAKGKSKVRK